MLMLAMNIDQHLAQNAQLLQGDWLTIDIGFGLALVIDQAPQQALLRVVGLLQIHVEQPLLGAGNGAGIKGSGDVGAAGAGAHAIGFGAIPQGERQCIQHNRFTRARFTGDHRHSGFDI